MKKKIVIFLLAFIVIASSSYAKYVIEQTQTVATIKIKGMPPEIKLVSVENTNQGYAQYANKTHTITVKVEVLEKQIKENYFNSQNIKILVGDQETVPKTYEIKKLQQTAEKIVYEIKLKQILGDGILKIEVPEKTIINQSNQENKKTILETGIMIDNTAPVITLKEQEIEEGKVIADLKINEEIRDIKGWNLTEDRKNLSKEFKNNVSYPLPVTDYAENTAKVEINIHKATNVQLEYGMLGDNRVWEFGQGNNEIVGKEMLKKNSDYKIEMISLWTNGAIENDFIQIQTYINTYWGEGKSGVSDTYENIYRHGYNPSSDSYASMAKRR